MRFLLVILPAFLLVASCGNLQNLANKSRAKRQAKAMGKLTETSSEAAAARLGAQAVGEVAYVDDAGQFVLIRTLTGLALPSEAALETRHHGKRTGLLRTTPEKKNSFLAADLLEGSPKTGEGVFPSSAKPKPTPPASPPVPPPLPTVISIPTSKSNEKAEPFLPALLEDRLPELPAVDPLDPSNLPPLKESVKTPEDLSR